MASIQYNGINLPYPMITDFRQESVRDDVSYTDRILTKFDISCQFVVNVTYLSELAPFLQNAASAVQNAAAIMDVIRSTLLQQRKALTVSFNGVNLVPGLAGVTGTVDAKNGPTPQECTPIQLNDVTFLVRYHIIAHYWENNKSTVSGSPTTLTTVNQAGNPALYNRWSETADIVDNYTTKTREGKFIIRSDNDAGQLADQIRSQMAVVSVPFGFLRESAHYRISPDGLGIEYRITDKEFFKPPPSPSFRAKGDYFESTPKGGASRFIKVQIALFGDIKSNQADMVRTAVQVATSKVSARVLRSGQGVGFILMGAALRIGMYENSVEFMMEVRMAAENDRVKPDGKTPIAAFANADTITPQENTNYIPKYLDRGTASLLLQAAAYYDPSLKDVILGAGTGTYTNQPTPLADFSKIQLNKGSQPGTAGKTPET